MAPRKKVLLAASGDLRQSANEVCWPAQEAMERQVVAALNAFDVEVERAHPYDPARRHGFIASQKEGLDVFSRVDPDLPIVVAEAVWQYSHHVLPGLIGHRGPILTVANWSGQWPGLGRDAQPLRLSMPTSPGHCPDQLATVRIGARCPTRPGRTWLVYCHTASATTIGVPSRSSRRSRGLPSGWR